ncbi:MAG TPA: hypothetical protein VMU48_05955 [Terracidiphilus sp.]|nr:hypothetical protein [Terracidiphilus sp.]
MITPLPSLHALSVALPNRLAWDEHRLKKVVAFTGEEFKPLAPAAPSPAVSGTPAKSGSSLLNRIFGAKR